MPAGIYLRKKKRSWKVKDTSNMGVKKGTRLSEETKLKLSIIQRKNYETGKIKIPNNKGRHLTNEWKNKISESKKGKPHSKEHIQKIREARRKQKFIQKDTKIEIKIQNFLKELKIKFLTNHNIPEISNQYKCDIFIPSMNLVIECDGCYWHGCPICKKPINNNIKNNIENDKITTEKLINLNYNIIRLWEHEIKNMELNDFKDIIQKFLVKK